MARTSATSGCWCAASSSGNADLCSSLVAGNSAPNGADVDGDPNDVRYSMISDLSDTVIANLGSGNPCNMDPLLQPLTNHGGASATHTLDPDSVAINAASEFCPGVDQRNLSRNDGACDMGAFGLGASSALFRDGFEG